MSLSFGKKEKLVSRKRIDDLFTAGKVVKSFPMLVKYNFEEGEPGVKIAFSVPKRRVKKAVTRNKIKRKLREAYRLNKKTLIEKTRQNNKNLALFLIYNGDEKSTFQEIQDKLILILRELEKRI